MEEKKVRETMKRIGKNIWEMVARGPAEGFKLRMGRQEMQKRRDCHPELVSGSHKSTEKQEMLKRVQHDNTVGGGGQQERRDCYSERQSCHPERQDCHPERQDCHPERQDCHPERRDCHPELVSGSRKSTEKQEMQKPYGNTVDGQQDKTVREEQGVGYPIERSYSKHKRTRRQIRVFGAGGIAMMLVATIVINLALQIYIPGLPVRKSHAATYDWVQTEWDWTSGLTSNNAAHPGNQTLWDEYSGSSNISSSTNGSISLRAGETTNSEYAETFTSTTYKDEANTTANWDTAAGTVTKDALYAAGLNGWTLDTTNALDIAIDGDTAFIADGEDGLRIINITSTTAPSLTSTFDTGGTASGIAIDGDYAYIADGTAGLQIINITTLASPTLYQTIDTAGTAVDVKIAEKYAVIADTAGGLAIVNVKGVGTVYEVFTFATAGNAVSLELSFPDLYVVEGTSGIQVININSTTAPIAVGSFNTAGTANDIALSGKEAYIADGANGLVALNITNTTTPVQLTNSPLATTNALGVVASGDYVWVADDTAGMRMVDISSTTAMSVEGTYNTSGNATKVAYDYDVYVADAATGMAMINVFTPQIVYSDITSAMPGITLSGTYNTPGTALGVTVSGNYAYVADYTSGLQVINISNPASPSWVGWYDTPGFAYGVTVSGDYAYVTNSDVDSLQVIDISNPASPSWVGVYNLPDDAFGVVVNGNYAYVADDNVGGLQVINIANPAAPSWVGWYNTPGSAYAVTVSGNYAYVADYDVGGLQVINISNPASPSWVGWYNTPGYAYGVTVSGNYAYVADYNTGGLQVINISNPASPSWVGWYDTPGYAFGVTVSGNYVYMADSASGLQVIDVSNLSAPPVGRYNTSGNAYGVAVSGNYAYVADSSAGGLQVINISNPAAPSWVGWYNTPGSARDVEVSGNYAYVADSSSSLQVINIANPASPSWVGWYDTPGSAWSVTVSGNYAYVADYNTGGLQVIDISNPASPSWVGWYNTPGYVYGVTISGNYAYVADYNTGGLQVIDISNPASPSWVGWYNTPGTAQDVTVSGNYAYVADGNSGLQVINISNPAAPSWVGWYNTPGTAWGVTVSGNYAYVGDDITGGLQVINIANPAAPSWVGWYNTPGTAWGVTVSGNYAYVGDDITGGLQVINIANPAAPSWVGWYDTGGTAWGVTVSGNYAYVGDYDYGLQVIQLANSRNNTTYAYGQEWLQTLTADATSDPITQVKVDSNSTLPAGTYVDFYASTDGGTTWDALTEDVTQTMTTTTASDLRIKARLGAYSSFILTPTLSDFTITYGHSSAYMTAGYVYSSAYNAGDDTSVVGSIGWTVGSEPAGTNIKAQIQTAPDSGGSPGSWTDLLGPTGTGDYYEAADASEDINSNHTDGASDRWMRYKITLTGDGTATPTVNDVTMQYVVNAPPNFDTSFANSGVYATQNADGTVGIGYYVRDIDTSMPGAANPYGVMPTFSYWNGSDWADCTTFASGEGIEEDTVEASNYTKNTSTWYAITDYPDQYKNGTFKVRVTVNDGEGANATASQESALFTLDTTDPTSASVSIASGATTTETRSVNLIIAASDDSSLQMKVANSLEESYTASYETYGTSKEWTLSTGDATKTVYVIFKDAYGNIATATDDILYKTPPTATITGASQGDTGDVTITYTAGDTENATVDVYVDFWTGSAWSQASTLSGSAGAGIATSTDARTITWGAKTDWANQYLNSSNGKVRLRVDDGNTGATLGESERTTESISSAFEIDTANPTVNSISVKATTTPATIKASITDDTMVDGTSGTMEVTLTASDLDGSSWYSSGTVTYATSTTISLATDPDTVYARFRDIKANSSTVQTLTTPGTPSNAIIQDVSNMNANPDIYQMFVNWEVVAAPTPGFKQYVVNRSTDGTNYTHLATITDRETNYYMDASVAYNTTYYYKISTQDSNDNVSYYSTAVYGIPNGAQDSGEGGGGEATAAPVISGVHTSATTTQSITVNWTTDELSDSRVGYSTTAGDFTTTRGVATMATTHAVTLIGLTPNTAYYYQVQSVRPSGAVGTDNNGGNGYTFTTNAGAAISNVRATDLTNAGATIQWDTDVAGTSDVIYSTNSDLSGATTIERDTVTKVTSHSVALTGLTEAETYYYYVRSTDAESNIATDNNGGNYYTFNTANDTTGPTISAVTATNITYTSAEITWTTSEKATSQVEYGGNDAYGSQTTLKTDLVLSHSVVVSGLTEKTAYHYKVKSKDGANNLSQSGDYSFTTLDEPDGGGGVLIITPACPACSACPVSDENAPKITDVKVDNITHEGARVSWATNEVATSAVHYGKSSSMDRGEQDTSDETKMTLAHQVDVQNLDSNTFYHYKALSRDAKGNLAMSNPAIFKTLTEEEAIKVIEGQTNEELAKLNDELKKKLEEAKEKLANAETQAMIDILKEQVVKLKDQVQGQLEIAIKEMGSSMTPPVFIGETPEIIVKATQAEIKWKTDKESNSIVAYAREDEWNGKDYKQEVGQSEEQKKEHEVVINSLMPGTTYHLQLKSKSILGEGAISKDYVFTTKAEQILINNAEIKKITDTEAQVTWSTNLPGDSLVKYAIYEGGYPSKEVKTEASVSYEMNHMMRIKGLKGGSKYEVGIESRDLGGNKAAYSFGAYRTTEDVIAPDLTYVRTESAITSRDKVQVIITYQTDEPSTTQMFYQEGVHTPPAGEMQYKTELNKEMTTKHVIVLTTLKSGIAYRFFVEAVDESGNKAVSRDFTVLTPRKEETVVDIIMDNFKKTFGWVEKLGF